MSLGKIVPRGELFLEKNYHRRRTALGNEEELPLGKNCLRERTVFREELLREELTMGRTISREELSREELSQENNCLGNGEKN